MHVGPSASDARNVVLQNSRKLNYRNPSGYCETLSQLSLELEPALEYVLRISPKARRLSMRVEAGRGLIVTVPKRFPRREILAFVESNRTWVAEALEDIEDKTPARYRQWPPREMALQALQQCVGITYLAVEGDVSAQASPQARETPHPAPLDIPGHSPSIFSVSTDPDCKAAVATELARRVLPAWLAAKAAQTGLHYERVSIRGQRTVWGSYSSSGTLSLNYKLLFLRRELVDYVLLHELAHTRHLDHSPQFWQQLESMQSNARALDSELKEAGRDVPPWLELAR